MTRVIGRNLPGPVSIQGATASSSVYCIAGLAEADTASTKSMYSNVDPSQYALLPINTIVEQSGGFTTSRPFWIGNDPGPEFGDWQINVPVTGWYECTVQFVYDELYFQVPVTYGEIAHWLYSATFGSSSNNPPSGPMRDGYDYVLVQRPFFLSTEDDHATFDQASLVSTPFDDAPQIQLRGVLWLVAGDASFGFHVEGQYRAYSGSDFPITHISERHVTPAPTVQTQPFLVTLRKFGG